MSDLIDREALRKLVKELLDLAVKRVDDTPTNSPCYRMYVAQENERKRLIDLIDNAPAVEPEKICIATVTFDKEQLQEIVDKAIADYQLEPIRCKDCKHQKKFWHEDKRMKDKGYWVYDCEFIDDPFTGIPVCGQPDEFCSSAERRVSDEPQ